MYYKNFFFTLTLTSFISASAQHDWTGLPVPADPGDGKEWKLEESVSDDFNYSSPPNPKSEDFLEKWDDWYHNGWTGPGLTIWRRENSLVEDGMLKLTSNRSGTNKVNLGIIHSNETIVYPVYIEGRAKIMNASLANGMWLLSPDDTQEIDFMEGYGTSFSNNNNQDRTWFAERMHMSHHVFIRSPFQDWQPSDQTSPGNPTWVTVKENGMNILWREDFHTYGVYWKDPWHLYYYIDGVLVTKKEGKDEIDPLYYTNATDPGNSAVDTRTGLSKPMDIILDAEDQDWLSNGGVTPTDEELTNEEDHTFKVDWLRVYKPVKKTEPDPEVLNIEEKRVGMVPNPVHDTFRITSEGAVSKAIVYRLNGTSVTDWTPADAELIDMQNEPAGIYLLNVSYKSGKESLQRFIKL